MKYIFLNLKVQGKMYKKNNNSQHKKGMDVLEWLHQGVTKMIKGLEHLTYKERQRELGLFSPEKTQEGCCQCVKIADGGKWRRWSQTLLSCISEMTRGNGHCLECRKFHWNIRESFFFFFFLTMGLIKCWHRLPSDCGVLSLQIWRYRKAFWTLSCALVTNKWIFAGQKN